MKPIVSTKLRVKFMHRGSYSALANDMWLRQFPDRSSIWSNCEFIFDPDERRYDWLVVFHDMPPQRPGSRGNCKTSEDLACSPANTLHVNYEPSSITNYGQHYLLQFAHLLTSQESEFAPHPSRIYSQPGLPWFYGRSTSGGKSIGFDEISKISHMDKSYDISTVCSKKRTLHTKHRLRYKFTKKLKQKIPSMKVFGYDSCRIDDKSKALDDYKFHVAIENHFAPHHWTEKLADSYLGFCVPIYAGCTNISDYFPPESYLTLNTSDIDESLLMIEESINSDFYDKALPLLKECRTKVLNEYNLFATLSHQITQLHHTSNVNHSKTRILSRPALWQDKPIQRVKCVLEKTKRTLGNTVRNLF